MSEQDQAPEWFLNLVAEWMIKYGPDRHCDGYEVIGQKAWEVARRGYPLSKDQP